METLKAMEGRFQDLAAPEAVEAYFTELYREKGEGLDAARVVERMEAGIAQLNFPFRTVAEEFHIIPKDTQAVLIPKGERAEGIAAALRRGERTRALLRDAGRYSVNVYPNHFQSLDDAGALELLEDGIAVLSDLSLYGQETGLSLEPESGKGFWI